MIEEDYIESVKRNNARLLEPGKQILFKWPALEELLRDAHRAGVKHGESKAGADMPDFFADFIRKRK